MAGNGAIREGPVRLESRHTRFNQHRKQLASVGDDRTQMKFNIEALRVTETVGGMGMGGGYGDAATVVGKRNRAVGEQVDGNDLAVAELKRRKKSSDEKLRRAKMANERMLKKKDRRIATLKKKVEDLKKELKRIMREIEDAIESGDSDGFYGGALNAIKNRDRIWECEGGVPRTFLQRLYSNTDSNAQKPKNMNRYTDEVKDYAINLLLLGGPSCYVFVQKNLVGMFPDLSSARRYLRDWGWAFEEGIISSQVERVVDHFERCGAQTKAAVHSEDGTALRPTLSYDAENNTFVGLVYDAKTGNPSADTPLAKLDRMIEERGLSSTAYVIMLTAVDGKGGSMPIACFGTDNRFTAVDVQRIWKLIKNILARKGWKLWARSSDGDAKLVRAMKNNGSTTRPPDFPFALGSFFVFYPVDGVVSLQDPVHGVIKLRNRFTNDKAWFIMGQSNAALYLVKELLHDTHPYSQMKTDGRLKSTDVDVKDKMDFPSAVRLTRPAVIKAVLDSHQVGSTQTAIFLECMGNIIDAVYELDPNLSALDRLRKIWASTFFFRLWLVWLKVKADEYPLSNHFITMNAYFSIESIAHGYLLLILQCSAAGP